MPQANINLLAVLVAGIAPMVLGFIWYGPLFGKQWTKLMGFTQKSMEEAKKEMGKTYGLSFLGSLVMAYVLAHFVDYANATTFLEGALTGFWAWAGFVATVMLTEVLYGGKSVNLYYINTGYQLASLVLMGALLAVWV